MNIFKEAADNRQYLTITQENLSEFKEWLNNSNELSGYFNFSIAEDVPFADIIPDNHNDKKKIEAASYIIFRTLQDDDRMKECFDLSAIAPQVPSTVYYITGNRSGNNSFFEKLGETIKARKMTDNLALVAHNIYEISEFCLPGQQEDIRTLPKEKREDLKNILEIYTRSNYGVKNLDHEQGAYNKIRFASAIFSRGDLLNYDGLSGEQRKQAVAQYIRSLPNKPKYVGEDDTRISEALTRLDEKYLTVDLLKDVMMGTERVWDEKLHKNIERMSLRAYAHVEFELSGKDKINRIEATYQPRSSGEYAKKDTSKAKNQAEKNANILSYDYKKVRDFLIKESKKRNKNSANFGFQSVCCELYGVKSFDEVPSLIGLLADVNLKTAQHDILNGNVRNLSPQAIQLVLDTDKNGYYARKVSSQDIEAINHYSDKTKVNPSHKTKAIIDRDKILEVGDHVLNNPNTFNEHYKGLTGKEKQAILARSEVAFKANTIYFRLEMAGQTFEKSIIKSREFAIIASDAVQQKKDFTLEQKAELKELTGQDYSAQDILNILDKRYKDEKKLVQQRIEIYKKVEAVKDIANKESKDKTTADNLIKKLQTAYKEIQNCSKNKNFEAKDEEAYKSENVELLIADCLNGRKRSLFYIEKPSFIASIFAQRKEEQRQKLNSSIHNFNQVLSLLAHETNLEVKQYAGKILSPGTREQSQKKADNAGQTSQTINELSQEFFKYHGYDDHQVTLATQIFAASPQPIEKLRNKDYISDYHGRDEIEQLEKMSKGEKIFSSAYKTMEDKQQAKRQATEATLVQEASKQKAQQTREIQARTRAAREKIRAKGGNVTLLEKIDAGIKDKEEKRSKESKTFDKLAIKEALNRSQHEA